MKKLLSLMAAALLSTTAASAVVACGSPTYADGSKNNGAKIPDAKYDIFKLKAAMIARAKTLVVEDVHKLDEKTVKDYTLNTASLGDYLNSNNKEINDQKIGDFYSDFIFDGDTTKIYRDNDSKTYLDTKGTIGQDGRVINEIFNKGIDAASQKIWADHPEVISAIIKTVMDFFGFDINSSTDSISKTLKTYLGAMAPVSTKVAVEGLASGLGLIPNMDQTLLNGIIKVWGLIDDQAKVSQSLVNGIDKLNTASDMSQVANIKVSEAPAALAALLGKLVSQGNNPDLGNMMQFVSIFGYYLSFLDDTNDANHSVIDRIIESKDINLNDPDKSKYYVVSDDGKGTGFNISAFMSDVAHYLGSSITEDNVLRFAQMIFLTADGKTIGLNDLAKMLFVTADSNNPISGVLYKLIKSLFEQEGKTISVEEAEDIFLSVLTNTTDEKMINMDIDYQSDKTKIKEQLDALFAPQGDLKKPAEFIWNDWTKLGKFNDLNLGDALSKRIGKDSATWLKGVFLDDKKDNITFDLSFKTVITKLPIYKFLYLNNQYGTTTASDYGYSKLKENGGILPAWGGTYTQSSISDLAKELDTTFNLKSQVLNSENIKGHYFDFSRLKLLVSQLLQGSDPVINKLINALSDPSKKIEFAKTIGYGEDGNGVNPNIIKKDSFVGLLIGTFMPALSPKGDKLDGYFYDSKDLSFENINGYDDLVFAMSGISRFAKQMLNKTDYSYWLWRVLGNNTKDSSRGNDINSALWFYKDQSSFDWLNGNHYGFNYYDSNGNKIDEPANMRDADKITLVLEYNLPNAKSIINTIPADAKYKYVYSFTVKWNSKENKYQFVSYDSAQDN